MTVLYVFVRFGRPGRMQSARTLFRTGVASSGPGAGAAEISRSPKWVTQVSRQATAMLSLGYTSVTLRHLLGYTSVTLRHLLGYTSVTLRHLLGYTSFTLRHLLGYTSVTLRHVCTLTGSHKCHTGLRPGSNCFTLVSHCATSVLWLDYTCVTLGHYCSLAGLYMCRWNPKPTQKP
jgi:hypothetical protein